MTWELIVAKDAQRNLKRFPGRDRERIVAALREMQENPHGGDVKRLTNYAIGFRRRVGAYRILFNLDPEIMRIEVLDIERRSDRTYRRRS